MFCGSPAQRSTTTSPFTYVHSPHPLSKHEDLRCRPRSPRRRRCLRAARRPACGHCSPCALCKSGAVAGARSRSCNQNPGYHMQPPPLPLPPRSHRARPRWRWRSASSVSKGPKPRDIVRRRRCRCRHTCGCHCHSPRVAAAVLSSEPIACLGMMARARAPSPQTRRRPATRRPSPATSARRRALRASTSAMRRSSSRTMA